MSEPIPGIKVIRFDDTRFDAPDDPTYPFKLEASFGYDGIHRASKLIVRGMTREALEELVSRNHFRAMPRLEWLTIHGPNNELLVEVRKNP